MLRFITSLGFTMLVTCVLAQNTEVRSSTLGLQSGYSLNARVELGKYPVLHISANGGIGSVFLSDAIYPTLNAEVLMYTGGFGTRKPNIKKSNRPTVDIIVAMTITAGTSNQFQLGNETLIEDRNIPLYYFANYSYPSLINPFENSLSVGTNLIWSTDEGRSFQRVGFLNLHAARFQASYYNDGGPPMSSLGLGDKRDRYYTGGGVISYHGPKHTAINLIEATYHKFTGYSKNSYEVAGHLQQAFVSYKDTTQKFYNRSLWSLNVANPSQHWGLNIREYNRTSWDMQHRIHWGGYSPFHLVSHPRTISVSAQGYFSQVNVGLR